MAVQPGQAFNYCTGCSYLLTALLERATGVGTRDFAEQALFKPLKLPTSGCEQLGLGPGA
jgi:CubicO group peptidase (beta-lactamase class C family)